MVTAEIINSIQSGGYLYEIKIGLRKPEITYGVAITYVLLVKWIIPWSLKDRKPFYLREVVIIYNFLLSLLNGYVAYQTFSHIAENWTHRCMVQKGRIDLWNQYIPRAVQLFYYGFLLKYVELLDTIFFALRKKQSHISFLHVFHHVIILLLFLWGHCTNTIAYFFSFAAAINYSVHVIMYLYYGLAAVGPSMQKYLWWKKYLTLVQMGQFVIVLLYGITGILTGCEKATKQEITLSVFVASLLILFANFYVKAYNNTKRTTKKIK